VPTIVNPVTKVNSDLFQNLPLEIVHMILSLVTNIEQKPQVADSDVAASETPEDSDVRPETPKTENQAIYDSDTSEAAKVPGVVDDRTGWRN